MSVGELGNEVKIPSGIQQIPFELPVHAHAPVDSVMFMKFFLSYRRLTLSIRYKDGVKLVQGFTANQRGLPQPSHMGPWPPSGREIPALGSPESRSFCTCQRQGAVLACLQVTIRRLLVGSLSWWRHQTSPSLRISRFCQELYP